jgi:pimeloyl-ACP methyl ester carboxylesterase
MRRKLLKFVKIFALGAIGLVVLIIGGGFGLLTYAQHRNAEALAIHTPNGIDEASYVSIGGIEQWVQIRGEDRTNPVLLFVHGGPGGSALHATASFQPWEKYFTVVLWDQRGAGRTYRQNGASEARTMTIERMTADGIEVSEFLRTHLHQDKIILLGHSWGSILGIHMIKQRPDLFAGYVGTGQVVDMQQNEVLNYAHVLAQAQAAHNPEALAALAKIGAPPFDDIRKIGTERQWADTLGAGVGDDVEPMIHLARTTLSPLDFYYGVRGFLFSQEVIFGATGPDSVMAVDLRSLGPHFDVPMFFFEGTADQQTPIELAEQYFSEIEAPHKEFIRFPDNHHFVVFNRPDEFLKELVTHVRPLAVPPV